LLIISNKQHVSVGKGPLSAVNNKNTRINIYSRVSQMKTLNTVCLVIYWTQKVHNDFIFLCSILLPSVGHSSNHEDHFETYKIIELCFKFLSHFYGFHLTLIIYIYIYIYIYICTSQNITLRTRRKTSFFKSLKIPDVVEPKYLKLLLNIYIYIYIYIYFIQIIKKK